MSMDTLDVAVQYTDNQQKNGEAEPKWVEWLMGYPSGWTDLKLGNAIVPQIAMQMRLCIKQVNEQNESWINLVLFMKNKSYKKIDGLSVADSRGDNEGVNGRNV